jgi:hypothetical protein
MSRPPSFVDATVASQAPPTRPRDRDAVRLTARRTPIQRGSRTARAFRKLPDVTTPVDAGPGQAGAGSVVAEPEWTPPSWRIRLIILAVLAIAVAVIGLAGGLERAPDPANAAIPAVGVNVDVDGGPWTMAVTSVALVKDVGGNYSARPGTYQLLVGVRVAVPGPETQNVAEVGKIVTLPDYVGLADPKPRWVVLYRDATRLEWILPDLPETVVYIFEVADTAPVPDHVTVELNGWVAHWGWTAQRYEWTDFGPHAQVNAPLKDAR